MAHAEKPADDPTKGAIDDINQSFPLDAARYEFIEVIGRGVRSVVHKAKCTEMDSSVVVAIKVIALQNPKEDLEKLRRKEAKIATLPDNPNILRAHCSFTVDEDSSLWVVMPLMSGGSLQSIIAWAHPLPEACIATVLQEILTAIYYIHGQGLPHGDIKASNILIDSNGALKLADLGVSASVCDSSGNRPYWVAPEVKVNGFRGDMWSFGILALEIARGGPPFSVSHLPPSKSSFMMEVTKIIQSFKEMAGSKSLMMKITKMTWYFKHMVGLCLKDDPSKRPTAKILLLHPFFKKCKFEADLILMLNVLQGVPEVEKRLKGAQIDRYEAAAEMVKNERISRWKLNDEGFGLVPVFEGDDEGFGVVPVVEGDDEGVGLVPVFKGDDEENGSGGEEAEMGESSDQTTSMKEQVMMRVIVNLEMEGVGNEKSKWYEFDIENQKRMWSELEMASKNQMMIDWAEVYMEMEKLAQLQHSME